MLIIQIFISTGYFCKNFREVFSVFVGQLLEEQRATADAFGFTEIPKDSYASRI